MDSVKRREVRQQRKQCQLIVRFHLNRVVKSATSPEILDKPMGDITHLLHQWRAGSREAENQLFTLVFPNLRRLAHYLMQRERKDHSLQATELVDELYFRLVAAKERDWQNRKHFFAIAARAMRRYLIDHARGRPVGGVRGAGRIGRHSSGR